MSCFFPSIFKKNTYKKVKYFALGLVLALVLLLSGCKIARTVVAAPFKAVGWGATKVSEVVSGEEADKPRDKAYYQLNPDGSLTEKPLKKQEKPVAHKNKNEISFSPFVFWVIILLGIALTVRQLVRYVCGKKHIKK